MYNEYIEFENYAAYTRMLFIYMNGRINVLNNNCNLEIGYIGENYRYGAIRYPNHITIYIGSILSTWNDKWTKIVSKKDYVMTCVALAIAHELHHADQLISMLNYNDDINYRKRVEGDVERASYDWVVKNAKTLETVGNFKVVLDCLSFSTLPKTGHYKKASIKELYLQIIKNVLFKNPELYRLFKIFENDKLADDIIIFFNEQEQVMIKRDGTYMIENLSLFSNLVFKYASYFDRYSIKAEMLLYDYPNNHTVGLVNVIISNAYINPIYKIE